MFLTRDIGIDLGTANILVYAKGQGIVLQEPSVVAVNKGTGKVLAVGNAAKQMIGRTPGNIVAIRPIKEGVIADFEYTQTMLKYYIDRALKGRKILEKIRVVICVPSGVTPVEERAVKESALNAGAKHAYIVEEPMAAAIGVGLPVYEPTGSMIVDIGGGTSDVAVISLGGIVNSCSIRIAGDEMDSAIMNHVKKAYNLAIGERMAEEIKINIGTAFLTESNKDKVYEVRGRDLLTGLPKTVLVSAKEIYTALVEPVKEIVDAVKTCLEKTPPELAADIMDRGIMMAGGGSLLDGLPKLLSLETGIAVYLADEPLNAVVLGTGKILENVDVLSAASSKNGKYHYIR